MSWETEPTKALNNNKESRINMLLNKSVVYQRYKITFLQSLTKKASKVMKYCIILLLREGLSNKLERGLIRNLLSGKIGLSGF